MHETPSWLAPASKGVFLAMSLILVMQAAALRMLSIPEQDLAPPGLSSLPFELGEWKAAGEEAMEPGAVEYLRPDEYILRNYVARRDGSSISLFVAHFKSLQNSYGPHSPRVCLPGSGWLVRSSKLASIQAPGRSEGIPVNEYVMERSAESILVIYWYQNSRDVWAEEFHAKLRLLPDLLRYHRSDVSLIRLVAPVEETGTDSVLAHCQEFTRLLYPLLVARIGPVK